MKTVKRCSFLLLSAMSLSAHAWDGYDWDKGTYVEVEKGNLVREGREIEVYEYGEGYKRFDVESINQHGSSVELEVRDSETGELRTFEMEDD
ncbi:MAG: DUF5334 family protein [Gammaproteobacteria bacterium]